MHLADTAKCGTLATWIRPCSLSATLRHTGSSCWQCRHLRSLYMLHCPPPKKLAPACLLHSPTYHGAYTLMNQSPLLVRSSKSSSVSVCTFDASAAVSAASPNTRPVLRASSTQDRKGACIARSESRPYPPLHHCDTAKALYLSGATGLVLDTHCCSSWALEGPPGLGSWGSQVTNALPLVHC